MGAKILAVYRCVKYLVDLAHVTQDASRQNPLAFENAHSSFLQSLYLVHAQIFPETWPKLVWIISPINPFLTAS